MAETRLFFTVSGSGRTYFHFLTSATAHCRRHGLTQVHHAAHGVVWDITAEVWDANRRVVRMSYQAA